MLGVVQIFACLPRGNTVTLDVRLSDTIGHLRKRIEACYGIPRGEQRLISGL